ncbi:hypothetical protein AAG747_14060 [Rapidithrix thailandica]|uniref:Uncharacterized protein n=1 Tax=Rapidithrix thailandica TaxID=413964 RepID=A0AAW9RW70_9BACT
MSLRHVIPTMEAPGGDQEIELNCAGFQVINRGACPVFLSFTRESRLSLELAPGESYRSPVFENLLVHGKLWLSYGKGGGNRNAIVIKYSERNEESFE